MNLSFLFKTYYKKITISELFYLITKANSNILNFLYRNINQVAYKATWFCLINIFIEYIIF